MLNKLRIFYYFINILVTFLAEAEHKRAFGLVKGGTRDLEELGPSERALFIPPQAVTLQCKVHRPPSATLAGVHPKGGQRV